MKNIKAVFGEINAMRGSNIVAQRFIMIALMLIALPTIFLAASTSNLVYIGLGLMAVSLVLNVGGLIVEYQDASKRLAAKSE